MSQQTARQLRIGIVGAGMIATVDYGLLPNLARLRPRIVVRAIFSRTFERATAVAERFQIPTVHADLDAMLADPDIDAIVNLTPIDAHFQISVAVIDAGKHLVTEKPLAATMAEADILCETAARRGLMIVCAPIDVLADEWRQARRLVEAGAIGQVAFARVQSSHGGPALLNWPTDPTWFYQAGAGPLFDLGVYGLHRITGVLGPARRVSAFSGITSPTRVARGGPFSGLTIQVTEPDNTIMMLDFGESRFAMLDATFNVMATRSPLAELYGSEGTLVVHPSEAPVPVELFRLNAGPEVSGWIAPATVGFPAPPDRSKEIGRALLVEHLADCLDSGMPPALSAEHARHVLEIMVAARDSAATGAAVELTTTFQLR